MLLEAFAKLLSPAYEIVGTASNGRDLLADAPAKRPDVVVVDVAMPRLSGLDAAAALRRALPGVKVVFLTVSEDPDLAARALAEGAAGYLLKKCAASELLLAIDEALKGRTYVTPLVADGNGAARRAGARGRRSGLTERQKEVLRLLAQGYTMKQAARVLRVAARTVAHHKYTIMAAMGLDSSADLVRLAVREGLISP